MKDNKSIIINIIGRGNVASHLFKAFESIEGISPVIVNPHTFEGFNPEATVTIISVTDNAIADICLRLPRTKSIIVHTSGSTPIDILSGRLEPKGVFYPFQTFSKEKALDYSTIPFFIEASDTATEQFLMNLASKISTNVHKADSVKRRSIHVAGVYACNFVNYLWSISDTILQKQGIDFNVLLPLIQETLDKTAIMKPMDGQTGPAVRHDTETIKAHLDFLKENGASEDAIKIYNLITASIMNSYPRIDSKK